MNTLRFHQPVPGVGLLMIDRPDRHNALDLATMRAFAERIPTGLRLPYEEALAFEHRLFPDLWTGETHRQSFDTFLNKRGKP